jgi:hypothetical protein
MSIIEKLNKLAEEAGYSDLPFCGIIESGWGDKTSTTIVFDKSPQDVFQLNPIIACPIKDHIGQPSKVPSDYKGLVAVHRAAISYGLVSRIVNVSQMKAMLDRIINLGIIDLTNQVGFLHGMKVTMKLPDGTYFRELTEASGYELRISVIKE